jgi:hypothetical protein
MKTRTSYDFWCRLKRYEKSGKCTPFSLYKLIKKSSKLGGFFYTGLLTDSGVFQATAVGSVLRTSSIFDIVIEPGIPSFGSIFIFS